jgi:hypothetical protein
MLVSTNPLLIIVPLAIYRQKCNAMSEFFFARNKWKENKCLNRSAMQCHVILYNKQTQKKKKHKCIYENLLQSFLMFEFLAPSSTKANDSKVVH